MRSMKPPASNSVGLGIFIKQSLTSVLSGRKAINNGGALNAVEIHNPSGFILSIVPRPEYWIECAF